MPAERSRKVLDPHLLRSMLDAAGDLIYVKDLDGVYLACNESSERLVGMVEAEQVGKTDFDFFPREFAQAIQEQDRMVMASGVERRFEEWVTYPDAQKIEIYLAEHSDARFTHALCPDCMSKHYPEGS